MLTCLCSQPVSWVWTVVCELGHESGFKCFWPSFWCSFAGWIQYHLFIYFLLIIKWPSKYWARRVATMIRRECCNQSNSKSCCPKNLFLCSLPRPPLLIRRGRFSDEDATRMWNAPPFALHTAASSSRSLQPAPASPLQSSLPSPRTTRPAPLRPCAPPPHRSNTTTISPTHTRIHRTGPEHQSSMWLDQKKKNSKWFGSSGAL